ncbi:MAG: bifunctional oligoribonuclease/PAP phosphatase NrnA [Candidatus Omnitrophota bacterium]
METIESIIKAIRKFERFLITSHMNLEGDSLGSQLAMANLLKNLGKDFVIFDNSRVPDHYQFLPHVKLIQHKMDIRNTRFDAAIVLDCPTLARTGKVKEAVKKAGYIINIDHHVSNERFGDLNWIEKGASSVGEMIYKLYKKLNSAITKEIALHMYIAILTDTGSFNYSNTSSVTHEIVSELLGYGIKPYDISKSIYENKSPGDIKLLARVLLSLKVIENGRIAYIVVRKKLFNETKTRETACEDIISFARSIKGVDAAVFFREDIKKKGIFHVSFRSSKGMDVNKVAATFGGGGHKSASGCTLRGNFEEIKRKVLKRIKNELR